ncbi:DgyrCDS10178 [Dimorphilus gyrociliatus]|uniref:DgyrCDS10178 n=1 Tax=Dimorphilus gyrociliatus TaxID=2664684 RepID=A0A7I8VZM6_9ANNE|nr:DgyrCDS10178 [Dimorphilus gyrociliatus]
MDVAKNYCLDLIKENLTATNVAELADCLVKAYEKISTKNVTILDLFEDDDEDYAPVNGTNFSKCFEVKDTQKKTIVFSAPLAIVFLLIMSAWDRRRRCKLNCCCAWPGCLFPVNLLDDTKRRLYYVCAFVSMSYLLLDLFFGENFWEIGVEVRKDPKMKWINTFVKMLNVCLLCLAFYPMFVCVRLHKVIFANLVGIGNMFFWLVIRTRELYFCTPRGSGYYNIVHLTSLAGFIPLLLVMLWQIQLPFYQNVGNCDFCVPLIETNAYKYVRDLLKPEEVQEPVKNIIYKIKTKFKLENLDGFKFSTRLCSTLAVGVVGMFGIAIFFHRTIDPRFRFLHDVLEAVIDQVTEKDEINLDDLTELILYVVHGEKYRKLPKSILTEILAIVNTFRGCFLTGIYLSLMLHILFCIHMAIAYKIHIAKLYKGRKNFMGKSLPSPDSTVVSAFKYAGYQIAYLFWGFTLVMILITVVLSIVILLFIRPLLKGHVNWLIKILLSLWPSVLVSIILNILQLVLARLAFLQEKGRFFCYMLIDKLNSRDDRTVNGSIGDHPENAAPLAVDEEVQLKRNQIKFRWWKCYTLLNNPELVFDIKRKIHEEIRRKKREELLEKMKAEKELDKAKKKDIESEKNSRNDEKEPKKDTQIVVSTTVLVSSIA